MRQSQELVAVEEAEELLHQVLLGQVLMEAVTDHLLELVRLQLQTLAVEAVEKWAEVLTLEELVDQVSLF